MKRRYPIWDTRKKLPSSEKYSKLKSEKPQLASAIAQFREDHDLEELNIEEIYRDVRDRSPGRDVKL
jgi:hypothetical protein